MKKNKKNRIVIIVNNQMLRPVEPLLASYIRKDLKAEVIFLTKTKEDREYYKDQYKDFFSHIICNENNVDAADILNLKEIENIEEKAIKIEKKYNISLYRMFITNRVIGRGFFASGGHRHPKNRRHQLSNNKKILNLAVNEINFWEKLFLQDNLLFAINLPPHAHLLALKNNIKSLRLFEGRFKDYYAWFSNTGISPIVTKGDLQRITSRGLKRVTINKPYTAARIARLKDIKSLKLFYAFKSSAYKTLQYIYGKLRGYSRTNNSYFFDEVLYAIRYRKAYYDYKSFVSNNLEGLKGKKFIFFPLITEPEIAIHSVADDFFFQLSAINIISRDLPADYILVVKEHLLALGRRPKDFYAQINDLKNVVLVDPTDTGLEYIKKCNALACITGTAAWEAAVIGKPVISFSKNNSINILDHVFYVHDKGNLRPIFEKLENNSFSSKSSIIDGAKFYKAFEKKLFKIKGFDYSIPIFNTQKSINKTYQLYSKIIYKELKKSIKRMR